MNGNQMNGARESKYHAKINRSKKYLCIAKIGNEETTSEMTVNYDGGAWTKTYDEAFKYKTGKAVCIKHRCNDLLSYVKFLDNKFPTWTWFNVYSNREENKGKQLRSFTKYDRPISRDV